MPPLLKELFEGREPVGGQGAAYVCRGFACERPLTDAHELVQRLQVPTRG